MGGISMAFISPTNRASIASASLYNFNISAPCLLHSILSISISRSSRGMGTSTIRPSPSIPPPSTITDRRRSSKLFSTESDRTRMRLDSTRSSSSRRCCRVSGMLPSSSSVSPSSTLRGRASSTAHCRALRMAVTHACRASSASCIFCDMNEWFLFFCLG
ncbi:hypothetical protein AGDE_01563 [Angomonas deanei]|nr:hypothetical protein AGDE_01563 [Angomonas deanei]|eukprot:EPY42360.1 hypothetical protein AGDE_01563 [Angomonas deanei]